MVIRWDGRGWQRMPMPTAEREPHLGGVIAFSSSNVWAVGSVGASETTGDHPIVRYTRQHDKVGTK